MSISGISGQTPVNQCTFRGAVNNKKEDATIFNKFTGWYNDTNCTDGEDTGSLKAGEFVKEYAKGAAFGLIDTALEHPIATALTVAGTVGATILTGGAIAPFLVGAGILSGGAAIIKGAADYKNANTDGEAKAAARQMGTGTTGVVLSGLGAKSALKAAKTAGVESAANAENLNTFQSIVQCFKSIPDSIKTSAANAKGNILTLKSGIIHKGANKLQGGQEATSKASSADVKKLDLSGSKEEVLARYEDSGMFIGEDGKYYIPNKWSADEPYLATDGNVLMKYDDTDFAVCAKSVFEKSYGTTDSYNAGNFEYSKVDSLSPDSYINATKQAKTRGIKLPEGMKVQTLEGERTVQAGEIVAIDVEGNPYVQPINKFETKNILGDFIKPNNLALESAKNSAYTLAVKSEK